MYSAGTRGRTTGPWNISDAGPRFGSTKLATTIIRAALILAALSALLLIAASPAQARTEIVLYNFPGGSDGGNPQSSLISDSAGNFYGTTIFGGLPCNQFGTCGTVFELSPNGSGGWNETVLYAFTGGADGATPYSPLLLDRLGNLYGTASNGGANGYGGVVFKLSPAGASWTETVLYSFCSQKNCTDGAYPLTALIMDAAGNLYGTTSWYGGSTFELSQSGGTWREQVIAPWGSTNAGLTMDAKGNIFGGTSSIVFELSPNGTGWNSTVIHGFACRNGKCPRGSAIQGTPVLDQAGNIYGTTSTGGANNYGVVYKLSPGTEGKWREQILHSFKGGPKDGYDPWAGVVFDAFGNLYGTTCLGGEWGQGMIFELEAPIGSNKYYKERVLWSFTGTDGDVPFGNLLMDSAGFLYGTTSFGGAGGDGVVFELTP